VSNTSVPPSSRFENCTGDGWQLFQLYFNYSETDSGSYWCQIVTVDNMYLELSEPWMVDTSTNSGNVTECGIVGNTDSKCVAPATATSTLSSTTQDYSTSTVGTTTKPFVSATTMIRRPAETPRIPSHSGAPPFTTLASTAPSSTTPPADCTVGGTSCFVYLGAGLGGLAVIVVLLIVIIIVLVLISVRRGKKKGKGEKKYGKIL